ncbi:MAG: helix-turn-helix domain-containing protein [Planctomycetota bacterium]|jgi:DNA-binding transcriptional MerR regulator
MSILVRRAELVTNLGIPPATVKHYTEIGLFEPASKTERGHFLFDYYEVSKRYEVIARLKKKQLTLEEIKEELDQMFSN